MEVDRWKEGSIASPKILSPRSLARPPPLSAATPPQSAPLAGARERECERSVGWSAGRAAVVAVAAAAAAATVSCTSLTLSNEERLQQSESGVGGSRKVKKPEGRQALRQRVSVRGYSDCNPDELLPWDGSGMIGGKKV